MIPLLAALLSGYAIGKLMQPGWPAYAVCVPASAVVHLLTTVILSSFRASGMEVPDFLLVAITGAIQSPLLMLGVFLARRGAKRNTFEV